MSVALDVLPYCATKYVGEHALQLCCSQNIVFAVANFADKLYLAKLRYNQVIARRWNRQTKCVWGRLIYVHLRKALIAYGRFLCDTDTVNPNFKCRHNILRCRR